MADYISTSEAAGIIGCVDSRVRQLLREGVVAGKRLGRDWLVDRASAVAYRDNKPKPGRPPKSPHPAKPARRRKGGKQS